MAVRFKTRGKSPPSEYDLSTLGFLLLLSNQSLRNIVVICGCDLDAVSGRISIFSLSELYKNDRDLYKTWLLVSRSCS